MARKKSRHTLPQSTPPLAPTRARLQIKDRFKHLFAAIGLCAVTLIAYANSIGGGFIYDSPLLVLQDPRVQQASAENVGLIVSHTYWWPFFESGLYRPITTLSFLFNYSVLGNATDGAGYHWVNLLLHILNVLLLYALSSRLLKSFWPSVFVAALWAVHPVLTESVTNVAGRADLLAGIALLGGFLVYLRSTEATGFMRFAWLSGLAALTAFGVFSKENAVAILGVIVLYELAFWKDRKQLRGLLCGCLALLLPVLAMWYQRSVVLTGSSPPTILFVDNPLTGTGFLTARLTALKVLAKYIWLLVWPGALSWDHSYNQIPLVHGSLQDWLAILTVVAGGALAAILFRRNRLCFFLIGFAFVTMLPTSNLIILIGTIMAERFLYLPAIGFAACVVIGVYEIGRRAKSSRVAPIFLGILLAALAARTLARNQDWSTPLGLDKSGVRNSPNSFKTHDALAEDLFESDHSLAGINNAIDESQKEIAVIDPLPDAQNTAKPFTNAGIYYERRGTELARRDPGHVNPEIIQSYRKALQMLLRARSIDRLAGEGFIAAEKARGKLDSEIPLPGLPQLYQELAMTYVRLGDFPNALDAANETRLLSPERNDYELLSGLLFTANRKDDAATALVEGLLMTHNSAFLPRLRSLYASGLDTKGCGFTQTASGPKLNYSCEMVHNELCKASVELIDIFKKNQKPDVAADLKRQATEEFGCQRAPGN